MRLVVGPTQRRTTAVGRVRRPAGDVGERPALARVRAGRVVGADRAAARVVVQDGGDPAADELVLGVVAGAGGEVRLVLLDRPALVVVDDASGADPAREAVVPRLGTRLGEHDPAGA